MLQQLKISILLLGVMTILTGGVYPAIVTFLAHVLFENAANGSLIKPQELPQNKQPVHQITTNRFEWRRDESSAQDKVKLLGSDLIGQSFTEAKYFWGRLSATAPFPCNAASSSGSNLGPMNPDLLKNVQSRIEKLREHDPDLKTIPVDLVTASASGLDPHISPAAAEVQVKRVAKFRQMSENDVRTYVRLHSVGRQFGFLGEPRVNVLQLNLELDQIQSQ